MSTTQKHYLKINPYLDIISGIAVVLSFSDGIIKIIGREGSGKSVLTQLLAAELIDEDQEVVIFSDIPHSESELHDPIQQQLHLSLDENSDFYEALNRHIQERPFDQQKLILVFDDAEQIPDDCFAAIRILFEKNYHDRPEVSMVFAGTELLDQKLNEPANRTFNKNIILNFEVKPMSRSELEAFCNAYMAELGLQQKHRLTSEDLDGIYAETQGLPGKIPELIFAILDQEEEKKKAEAEQPEEKPIITKLVALDDDPEPELSGLSVEEKEEVLTAFKDQVPWRWQSNGVGIAVVVLFLVVAYGYFVPEEQRTNSIVIFPPPPQSPGQLTAQELQALAETIAQQPPPAELQEPPVEETPVGTVGEPVEVASTEPSEVEEQPVIPEEVADVTEQVQEEEPVVEVEETPAPESTEESSLAEQLVAGTGGETATEPESVPEPETTAEPQPVAEETPATGQVTTAGEEEESQIVQVSTTPVAPTPTPAVAGPGQSPEAFVADWLTAWEDKDLAAYFRSYSTAFTPPGQDTLAAWRDDRTMKINRPASIDIGVEDIDILSEDNSESRVRVQFTYESPTYADRTVKELALVAENGNWTISEERNLSVERLAAGTTEPASEQPAPTPAEPGTGESGYDAKIRQVLSLAGENQQQNTPVGMFINDWLGAWKSQDVEDYFRHYHNNFTPAYFDSMSDWRADRIRKINEKRFIEIAYDDLEVLDEDNDGTRIRFWISYASSFYLDRTLKEVVISPGNRPEDLSILQERNLEIEIIPFYP